MWTSLCVSREGFRPSGLEPGSCVSFGGCRADGRAKVHGAEGQPEREREVKQASAHLPTWFRSWVPRGGEDEERGRWGLLRGPGMCSSGVSELLGGWC